MTEKKGKKANKPNPSEKTMRDWLVEGDRHDAKLDFLDKLAQDPEERRRCIQSNARAKKMLACYGRFNMEGVTTPCKGAPKNRGENPIPKSTEVRVYAMEDVAKRNELVTIVLPAVDTDDEDIAPDWRCTYTPWAPGRAKKRRPKAKRATSSAKRRPRS